MAVKKKVLPLHPQSREMLFQTRKKVAEIAQLVEHDLAKVGVAGSSPVFRSSATSATIFEILHRYLMIYIVTTY